MTNHTTIAHRWAQNNKPGVNLKGYAMFCAGGRIYSHGHHFLIAKFASTPARRGKPSREIVLFNADGYSVSTAKHKTYTRRAIPSHYEVFEVPDLQDFDYSTVMGRKVLEWHVAQAVELYAKAKRARVNGPWLVSRANGHLAEAERFADAFGHRWKRPASLERLAEAVAKETAKQAKAAKKARAEQEARQKAEMERRREIDADSFAMWQAGESRHCPQSYRSRPDGSAYVRRWKTGDVDELQTSQGASVPWEHAVKAFRFIALCMIKGEGWQRNGRVVRVGHYQIDRIEPNGDMVAGCHRFTWDAMRALADREGVVMNVPGKAEAQAIIAAAVEQREGVAH